MVIIFVNGFNALIVNIDGLFGCRVISVIADISLGVVLHRHPAFSIIDIFNDQVIFGVNTLEHQVIVIILVPRHPAVNISNGCKVTFGIIVKFDLPVFRVGNFLNPLVFIINKVDSPAHSISDIIYLPVIFVAYGDCVPITVSNTDKTAGNIKTVNCAVLFS